MLTLIEHGVNPMILKEIPIEHEEYFFSELEHLMKTKENERRLMWLEDSYISQLAMVNNDPQSRAKPKKFLGREVYQKHVLSLAKQSERLNKHLLGIKPFGPNTIKRLWQEGYKALETVKTKREQITLQNGQKAWKIIEIED